ncbi:MAG: hypothetical protein M1831_002294 [Alyxoria varia]|nr:MAG: hypothetical protein M1831_002294 [Alyxoria varia]
MARSQSPSIQSFFHPSSSPISSTSKGGQSPNRPHETPASELADGFSSTEVNRVLYPTVENWVPERNYEEREIGSLIPGPQAITIVGRIVNFYDQVTPSKMPQAAKGCMKVIVKDNTGALTVRLWYANRHYPLRLGHLVSIWTPHISSGSAGTLSANTAPLLVSMFPERDRTCCFMLQEKSDTYQLCTKPLEYKPPQSLPGLMSLRNYLDGGHEINQAKILVCVKSLGPKKKVTIKRDGNMRELVNALVFDHTADTNLTLWGPLTHSIESWRPSSTVLLLTGPILHSSRQGPSISLNASTFVDVDPDFRDAHWLRRFAQKLTKREHVNLPFPKDAFDLETVLTAQVRPLFTLADVDEFVHAAPQETFTGFLSVILLEVNIALLHMRNMLLCEECCGIPIFANTSEAPCKQCDRHVLLRPNPRILQAVLDETAVLAPGSLIFSPRAWTEFLGRSPEQLASATPEVLRYMERRMKGLRVTFVFGWVGDNASSHTNVVDESTYGEGPHSSKREGADLSGSSGRLCVLSVMA